MEKKEKTYKTEDTLKEKINAFLSDMQEAIKDSPSENSEIIMGAALITKGLCCIGIAINDLAEAIRFIDENEFKETTPGD